MCAGMQLHVLMCVAQVLKWPLGSIIAQGAHGNAVSDFGKCPGPRGAHLVGGRIRAIQLGMLFLQCLEFPEHPVVLAVRYFRIIEHMVSIIVILKLLPKAQNPTFGRFLHGA